MKTQDDRQLRLLLVEDAPSLRMIFSRLLRMHGFDVRVASDGLAALECAHTFRPQVVVTDLMMPVMDGVELIRRLRSEPETAAVPVLAMTADGTGSVEETARSVGAFDVLPKPFELPTLLDRLHGLLADDDSPRAERSGRPE